MAKKRKICLVQQGVWNMACESMPLASGYLKAMVMADERLADEVDIEIFSFDGSDTTLRMVDRMFVDQVPDVVGFSVLGWNYNRFCAVAETFKQFNPEGWVIFGGNHVSYQAERVFGMCPDVDVIVNGEGELTFKALVEAYVSGRSYHDLADIEGISFMTPSLSLKVVGGNSNGSARRSMRAVTTDARERIQDLGIIPSPVLTGAIDLTDQSGKFRYDVGIMETNRGCPYKCAFCYWGGSIGQKVRTFPIDRLREEVELYGKLEVYNIALCDANFGMLQQDEEFVNALIRARAEYGYPRNFDSSWAKNKGKVFRSIVKRMQQSGFTSSFTLALQTLDTPTLELMGRKNMKVNDWEELASWLKAEGLECYAELIWGCPGQTYDSFIEGYDDLAKNVSRIATYPHLLMPNTDYTEEREKFGFVTHRGERDDFEYVLAHSTMTVAENRKMHRFLFWARVFGEYMVFRNIWTPLRKLEGITQSQVLLSLDDWIDEQDSKDGLVAGLRACRAEVVSNLDASRVSRAIHFCYVEDSLWGLFKRWWAERILPLVSEHRLAFFDELFKYEWFTRPVYDGGRKARAQARKGEARANAVENLTITMIDGEEYFVRTPLALRYNVPEVIAELRREEVETIELQESPVSLVIHAKKGFAKFIDNHEFYPQYVGKTLEHIQQKKDVGRIAGRTRVDDATLGS